MIHRLLPVRGLVALSALLLLAGCQHLLPSTVRTEVRSDDVALRAVLAYAREQAALDAGARALEIKSLEHGEPTPIGLMKLAVIHAQNRAEADPAKSAGLLEKVLADNSPDAAVFHSLARILHAQCLARVRLMGQNERLLKEYHEARDQVDSQQQNLDSLQQKLDALTDIERSLPAPASRPMESTQ